MTEIDPCTLCGLRVVGTRDRAGRCRHCIPQKPGQRPVAQPVARTSARCAPMPGAAALCRRCGRRLIACYPDQQYHPLCDPDPPGWTDQQLDEWCARAEARRAR